MNLTIETLVIVAIWKYPSIFQGIFTITNKKDNSKEFLFFGCELYLEDFANSEFSPEDYKFTDLQSSEMNLRFLAKQKF